MSQIQKLQMRLLSGVADRNFAFSDLCKLLEHWGFRCRISGSHHIFFKEGVEEIINLQPNGPLAKPYQVKQVRNLVIKYKIGESYD